jgi:hypothetical protein
MSILSIIALSSRYNLDVYRMISQISCCLIGSDEKFSYYQSTIIWIRAFRYSGGEGAMFLPEHDLFLQLKNKIIFFYMKNRHFFQMLSNCFRWKLQSDYFFFCIFHVNILNEIQNDNVMYLFLVHTHNDKKNMLRTRYIIFPFINSLGTIVELCTQFAVIDELFITWADTAQGHSLLYYT